MRLDFALSAPAPTQVLDVRSVKDLAKRLGLKGAEGEVVTLAAPPLPHDRVLLCGLGKGKRDAARMRRVGGALAAALAHETGEVGISLDLTGAQAAELAYGLLLRSYRPLSKYRTVPRDDAPGPGPRSVTIASTNPDAARTRFARYQAVARGVFVARDLVAEPGNVLTPASFAERAQLLAGAGLQVRVLDAEAEGLNLLHAVGKGSAVAPRLVVLEWRGEPEGGKPLVLVGKGITFDTGGLSIKPATHMEEMKGDMAGAAAVLGAMAALAQRKAPVNVVGLLALAENAVSGNATRPGDVVRSYKGLTVEIVDTDAEGRLVLADALAWACRNLSPRAIVDAATLTGAVVRVLGAHLAGLYSNDDDLARQLLELAAEESEPLWRLPLSERCDEHLKSDIADLRNCAWGPVPDNDDAARFLSHFVDEGIPWAHLDIAGTAETAEDSPLSPKGPTGFGVRLFERLAAL